MFRNPNQIKMNLKGPTFYTNLKPFPANSKQMRDF